MKKLLLFTALLTVLTTAAFADKLVFMEYALSYASAMSPASWQNNDTGAYDSAAIDARTGVDIKRWVDVYAGASFTFFVDRQNVQQHYSFFPVYGGIRLNLFPENIIYPDAIFEYGASFSNRRSTFRNQYGMDEQTDQPWVGKYYNVGVSVNWNVEDIAVLSFRLERPSIMDRDNNELNYIKTGLAWKIFY